MSASLLGLLSIQSGQILNPSTQDGATGGSSLDVDQRACELSAPVPIVFARRRNNKGGILIAPGATEARFENNAANDVTVYYHLVISEGQIDSIPVKDVFQRACRLGSHTQTYDRRAGVWLPGNYIVQRTGFDKPEASSYCGSVGLYSGISTLSFQNTVPNGFDQWRKQVHLFIRGGMRVTRLVDSVFGPSDNFADLFLWMLQNSGRVPAALIDQPALLDTATFLEANGFTCNVEIKEATNILDFVANWAPYFLLGESSNGGKKGLRPLLPVNANGTIKVTAIDAEYTFNESLIVQDSFSIEYINYADRLPFVAQLTWRQELGTDAAILRTSQVRFDNTSIDGPFESYDLSEFCTSEDHAVKIGTYIVVRRATVTHNISFVARPQAHNTILSPGSIIRVLFARDSNNNAPSMHDYFYQVERITKTLTGDVGYECSHFPIDSEGRSIVSLYVANTIGNGVLFTSNQTGVTCDLPGRDTDNTIPDEEFMLGDDVPGWEWDDENNEWVLDPLYPDPDPMPLDPPLDGFDPPIDLEEISDGDTGSGAGVFGRIDGGGFGGGGGGGAVEDNPVDGLDAQGVGGGDGAPSLASDGDINNPEVGDTLTAPMICDGGQVVFYRVDPSVEGGKVIAAQATGTYTLTINDVDLSVYAETVCPDPTSPTGYGEPIRSATTPIIRNPNDTPWYSLVFPTALSITFEYTSSSTGRVICSSGDLLGNIINTGTLGPYNIGNVVEWRVVNLVVEYSTVCGPFTTAGNIVCAIQTKNAAGVISSTTVQSTTVITSANTSANLSVVRTITSLKYDGFEMGYPPGS
jgi:hypothetical protein